MMNSFNDDFDYDFDSPTETNSNQTPNNNNPQETKTTFFDFDLDSDFKETGNDDNTVPVGVYVAEVEQIEEKTFNSGAKGISFSYRIVGDSPFTGKKVFATFILQDKNGVIKNKEERGKILWNLRNECKKGGFDPKGENEQPLSWKEFALEFNKLYKGRRVKLTLIQNGEYIKREVNIQPY